jgi:hypothetical protein
MAPKRCLEILTYENGGPGRGAAVFIALKDRADQADWPDQSDLVGLNP